MEALMGKLESPLPKQLPVMIHTKTVIQCHRSPRDKHFAHVNVLGADFLVGNSLTLVSNYCEKICTLLTDES
jgi:hypothetical protein